MKTLQFLIDHICADFTVQSLLGLVRTCLIRGPCAKSDITHAIMQKDRSLDIGCAEGLAEGALQALCETGEIKISESLVYATGSAPRPD